MHTERLHLRPITPDDVTAWAAILSDPLVNRHLSDFDRDTPPEVTIAPIIAWAQTIIADGTGVRWAITLDGTMIGSCGYHALDRDNGHAEIGYELSSQYWRQGIMSEALRAVLAHLFDDLSLHRVEADVTGGNHASAGLLRRLGFTHEGTWRERVFMHGAYVDLWQFGLLAHEYP